MDLAALVLVPKLQALVGAVQFGLGYGTPVLCEEHEDLIGIRIGVARARDSTPAIALRLVVRGSRSVATTAWEQMVGALDGLVAVGAVTIEPYRKSPDIHELSSTLRPLRDTLDGAYEATERRLGFGWTEYVKSPFGRWTVPQPTIQVLLPPPQETSAATNAVLNRSVQARASSTLEASTAPA